MEMINDYTAYSQLKTFVVDFMLLSSTYAMQIGGLIVDERPLAREFDRKL